MDRRKFLAETGRFAAIAAATPGALRAMSPSPAGASTLVPRPGSDSSRTLFLCGDVMTGRGIDQVLPNSVDPDLHEPWVRSAVDYVRLAERVSGPIPSPVDWTYVWGHALDVFARVRPDVRIVNLETSVTTSDGPWPGKGIHYRMHPRNVPALAAAGIDGAVLANNHVLDWGRDGLEETLAVLRAAGIATAGAGRNLDAARAPAVIETDGGAARSDPGGGRVLVYGIGMASSGIPAAWAATPDRSGVRYADAPDDELVERLAAEIAATRRAGDLVVVSVHWGPNWGYEIPRSRRDFARALIDRAGVDVIHGHSSHHPIGIEVHGGRPILYGCGDFLNDYEGITGREEYRGELSIMYFPRLEIATGRLLELRLFPCRIERFRLVPPSVSDTEWLRATLDRESAPFGVRIAAADDGGLTALWE